MHARIPIDKAIFDMSSIMWTSLSVGKDKEGREYSTDDGKMVHVNTAKYGYENAVNMIKSALLDANLTPIDMVMVFEGMNSKARRLMIHREYKAKRGKRPAQAYIEFATLKEQLTEVFGNLGALKVSQDNVEGDDVLAYLAKTAKHNVMIVTNDNDMVPLAGVNDYGAQVLCRINGVFNNNAYGMFPTKYVTLYKAMVGDGNDNIGGIPRFGKESWIKFHAEFGEDGMAEMVRLANRGSLLELESEAREHKLIKLIFDGSADFIRSWKLASLHPEWVNTMNDPLVFSPGMVCYTGNDERLKEWKPTKTLVTLDKWDSFFSKLPNAASKRPWIALDIETSTPEQSDEWLAAQGEEDGVDVLGSELTGMSLTFGDNMQHTVYIPVDHHDTNNVTKDHIFLVLKKLHEMGLEIVIHSTQFEGTVLYNEFGERWKDNGYRGYVPNWRDTVFEASYVNENESLGLKKLSKQWLNYDQVDYKTITTIEGVRHKMRQLTALHVMDYACDDTITTAALHNFFQFFMNMEGTYEIYKQVELSASYLHVDAFVKGTNVSLPKLRELVKEDEADRDGARKVIDSFLISKGWEGTLTPEFSEVDYKAVKAAYEIFKGVAHPTKLRTAEKIIAILAEEEPLVAAACADVQTLNEFVKTHFKANPIFNPGSPKQMQRLMYETLNLPIKLYNQPTDAMKARGETEGTPKTDALAITYALLDADLDQKDVLEALRVVRLVQTRMGLFYDPLPTFVHWKTGKVHSSHMQCGTNTRRASSKKPNLQQLSKHEKVEGFSPRVRELYTPHHKRAVIVSFDFKSQELLLMAEWSGDAALTACFVGEKRTDMHSKTGVGVYNRLHGCSLVYDDFVEILMSDDHPEKKKVKKARALGKSVNFGGQYRIGAKKLSLMLIVVEEEAQAMLDAKAEVFPQAEAWSLKEMEDIKHTGKCTTMMGAVRHLRDALFSDDRYTASKAPRQALSFRIQGSAAEMTKMAEGRMWDENILGRFDCSYFGPVHDECVWSVAIEDLYEFIPVVHDLMTRKYADMKLPIESSVSIGPDFGQQVELEGNFTKEHLMAIVAKFEKETA